LIQKLKTKAQISTADAGLTQFKMKRSHVQAVFPNEFSPMSWFVLRVRVKKEKMLVEQLLQNGYEAWLPQVKRFRVRAGRKEHISTPLISGYVFVSQQSHLLPDGFNLPGSNGLLLHEDKPALLHHADAMRLHQLCSLAVAPEMVTAFEPGQQVVIKSGPLKGISGTVIRNTGKRFLVVESGISDIMLRVDMERNMVE
jgi:transcription antitermination factor NusG